MWPIQTKSPLAEADPLPVQLNLQSHRSKIVLGLLLELSSTLERLDLSVARLLSKLPCANWRNASENSSTREMSGNGSAWNSSDSRVTERSDELYPLALARVNGSR